MHTNEPLRVQEDVINPCMQIFRKENLGIQLRVRYHSCRVAVEVFHAVTDGSGAITFLKTLVASYLGLQGISIPTEDGVLDYTEPPKPTEFEDSFQPFAQGARLIRRPESRAYQLQGTPLHYRDIIIIKGTIPINELKKAAKPFSVSITEYLTAVLLLVLNQQQIGENPFRLLPIRVQVPINLRNYFPSSTLRNFSSFVNVGLEPGLGDYHFEEILTLVHHYLRYEVNEKFLRSRVAANLRTEHHPLLRIIPLFLKQPMIGLGYKLAGPSTFTSILTNLGNIKVPDKMAEHVRKFEIILGASADTKVKCAVSGYNGVLNINFTRSIKEAMIEREFFRFLIEQGVPVEIESNQE